MSNTNNALILLARILLSFMFILAGFGKVTDAAGTAGMIAGAGLPAATLLAYVAGLFELLAGLAVLTGFQVRIVGWLLAGFCVFTGVVFHLPYASGAELVNILNQIMVMKNITLAGAYILLATVGAGAYSIDARRSPQAVAAR
ncbi:putative oxidoreductase [Rhizobium sp. BK275]|uniref:Oxidoreductase n=1 Tax=Rhizobium viscosum TaxID=1673 RepID=A0ABR9IL62_RHIVS|nr:MULTISPECIES: DoxX family protein [Rhizobium]MBB3389204.1 putative oxidoreductase [Rhizobium sp. BK275]MBE1503931.1 putative oxidoreductase [Rhizobium viscosum]